MLDQEKTCFFIGHAEADARIYPALLAAVEAHIADNGVRVFFVGHYGGFDRLAAQAVREAKRRYPEVRLTLLLPYHPAERPIPTLDGFDCTFYPLGMEQVPRKYAIVQANRYMVDQVDYLIAYVRHPASNAWALLDYAGKRSVNRGLSVTILPERHEGGVPSRDTGLTEPGRPLRRP